MLYIDVFNDETGATGRVPLTQDFLASLPQSDPAPPQPVNAGFVFTVPEVTGSGQIITLFDPSGTRHDFEPAIGAASTVAAMLATAIETDPAFASGAVNNLLTVAVREYGP